jgi:prevent-host-death family protein
VISIGIREFKEHASEVLRRVREDGSAYEVTYRGRAIAHVVPVEGPPNREVESTFWDEWRELAREISEQWPEGVSALDAVREDRRDL